MNVKKSMPHLRLVTMSLFVLTLLMISTSNVRIGYALTHIVINEIEYNPAGTDSGHEWVELYNPTAQKVSIGGWFIDTHHGITYRVTLPSTASISPYGYYVIGKSTQWLDNQDDYIILKNKSGVEVDRSPVLVDTSNNGYTWQRYPNGKDTGSTSDWKFRPATKGASNGGASTLTVTSPNGGQIWVSGTTHSITWTKTGTTGSYVKIELLKGGLVNRVITSSTANDGSYSWTIPSTQTLGTDYRIRITSTSNAAITDSSNSNFRIS